MWFGKFFPKNKEPDTSFNVDEIRRLTKEGEEKIREKAEKWLEENWIEQNIREAASLGRHFYLIAKVPKELSVEVRNYFGERGFGALVLALPPRAKDHGTRTVEITW